LELDESVDEDVSRWTWMRSRQLNFTLQKCDREVSR
jgi:hypothetical protein